MIAKFIIKRNGTPAAPNVKVVGRVTVQGSKETYKFRKQAYNPTPVLEDRILTETGDYLNTEISERITTG
jgi:hypothetical protein